VKKKTPGNPPFLKRNPYIRKRGGMRKRKKRKKCPSKGKEMARPFPGGRSDRGEREKDGRKREDQKKGTRGKYDKVLNRKTCSPCTEGRFSPGEKRKRGGGFQGESGVESDGEKATSRGGLGTLAPPVRGELPGHAKGKRQGMQIRERRGKRQGVVVTWKGRNYLLGEGISRQGWEKSRKPGHSKKQKREEMGEECLSGNAHPDLHQPWGTGPLDKAPFYPSKTVPFEEKEINVKGRGLTRGLQRIPESPAIEWRRWPGPPSMDERKKRRTQERNEGEKKKKKEVSGVPYGCKTRVKEKKEGGSQE